MSRTRIRINIKLRFNIKYSFRINVKIRPGHPDFVGANIYSRLLPEERDRSSYLQRTSGAGSLKAGTKAESCGTEADKAQAEENVSMYLYKTGTGVLHRNELLSLHKVGHMTIIIYTSNLKPRNK